MDFSGRTVVVTGGGRGIGRRISLDFAALGAKVAVCDIDLVGAESTCQEVKERGMPGLAMAFEMDVSCYESVSKKINEVIDKFSHIDILINNAGITRDSLIFRMKKEAWDKVISVNLGGVFNCTKEVVRYMIKRRYGKIVNISSVVGLVGNVGQCNYAASKAAVIGLTRSLAKELSQWGINVNAVCPGFIETDMTRGLADKARNELLERIPLKRFGNPEDVSWVVLFLSSDKSSYITGQVITTDGGMVI